MMDFKVYAERNLAVSDNFEDEIRGLMDECGLWDIEDQIIRCLSDARSRVHCDTALTIAREIYGADCQIAAVFGVTRTAIVQRRLTSSMPLRDYLLIREGYPDRWAAHHVEARAYDEAIRAAMVLTSSLISKANGLHVEDEPETIATEELGAIVEALDSREWSMAHANQDERLLRDTAFGILCRHGIVRSIESSASDLQLLLRRWVRPLLIVYYIINDQPDWQ